MSAAAPPPPPHHSPTISSGNGFNHHHRDSVSSTNGTVAPGPAFGGDGAGGARQRRKYPLLQDLVSNAASKYNSKASIVELLQRAGGLLQSADASLGFGREDYAYSEYIAAYTIVATVVPQHADNRMLRDSRMLLRGQPLFEIHKRLINDVNAREQKFGLIRSKILEENRRNDMPASSDDPYNTSSSNTSAVARPTNTSTDSTNSSYGAPAKAKPPVQPKPQSLYGAVPNGNAQRIQHQSNGGDTLSARFARLRASDAGPTPESGPFDPVRNPGQPSRNSVVASNFFASSPHSSRMSSPAFSNAVSNSARLTGPSNSSTSNGQANPGALSILPYYQKDLPKPPSPTYSPSRSLHDGSPMRSTRNSVMHTGGSTSSLASTGSLTYDSVPSDYVNAAAVMSPSNSTLNGSRPPGQLRRKSLNVPQETEIMAERLHDYLKRYNVLLIDVRSREEYDTGHIFTQTGICVEPAALRSNMSAEELQDAIVISPENEYRLFEQRDQFDLVVYYDQSTPSKLSFNKSNGNPALKYLNDALYEFNQEKPLRYPPVFMKGGMDAWIDLAGDQALMTSNTATRVKAGRPLARRPATSGSTKLNLPKRRRRDYNPLAPEEEERWRERARSETVVLDAQPQVEESGEEDEAIEPYPRNYDEFYLRFPDVATVERQSMIKAAPQRAAPEPPRIPPYPTAPVPTVPARPAPIVQRPSYSGVGERALTQNLPTTKPQQLAPYIPPKLKRLPRTGLHNYGATCYMNATIQCLSATLPLTAFFLEGTFENFLQKDNWKGSKGIMPALYRNLIQAIWHPNGVDTIKPTNFRNLCARLNREWASERQQDAKEFLEFLVDCLHEDLNVNWSRNPLRQLTTSEEAERERTPAFIAAKKEWSRYEHRDHSRLTDLFAGQHISRLQCTTCQNSSTTYEAFYSISVEIPSPRAPGAPISLDDCLRSYCAAEMLSGDEVWRCPHCRAEREATKRITISRAPEFLVIHLKRFSASHAERARKIHTSVEFPLTGFDLAPYMLPPLSADPRQRDTIAARYGKEQLEAPQGMQPPYRYDAYAVMRHLGASMTSGHYVGLVKDAARDCWREFNDDRIGDFRPEELPREKRLQNEMAYIVFYQRVPA